MYKLGKTSLNNLEGVLPRAVKLVHAVMDTQIMDFGIAEGVRSMDTQQTYFNTGRSKTLLSKHLLQDDGFGHALDMYPYPINMRAVNKFNAKEIVRFGVLNGIIQTLAPKFDLDVVWGADWDGDGNTLDHNFFDAMHWQFKLL